MPKRTNLDWMLEPISLAVLATMFITLWLHWAEIPDRVPRHFGFRGDANAWGGKAWLWALPLTAIGIYILSTVASRFPRLINLPFAVDRDTPEVKQLLLTMPSCTKATVLLAFAYIQQTIIHTALGEANGLGAGFLPIFLVAVFVPVIYFMTRLAKYRT